MEIKKNSPGNKKEALGSVVECPAPSAFVEPERLEVNVVYILQLSIYGGRPPFWGTEKMTVRSRCGQHRPFGFRSSPFPSLIGWPFRLSPM